MKQRILPASLAVLSIVLSSCAQHPVTTQTSTPTMPVAKSAMTDTRVPSSEDSGDTPWTTWSEKGTVGGMLVLKHIREDLLENNLHDPHINYKGYKSVDCSKLNTNFRMEDGTCNDLENPHVGAAGVAFGRNVAPEYIDQNAKENLMTPNPSLISKEFFYS